MGKNFRKLMYEDSGEVIMPFGKHKGIKLRKIPHDYLAWVDSNCELRPDLKEAIEMELMLGEDVPNPEL